MILTSLWQRIWQARRDIVVFICVTAAMSVYLVHNAMQRFDFYDMSSFLDAGYRVWIGQEPYVDFYYNAGPVHLYMHAASFALFGYTKEAILAHLLVVHIVVLGCAYVLARRHLNTATSAVLTALVSLSFFGPVAHPWYDQNASAFFVLALLLFELTARAKSILWAVLGAAFSGSFIALSFMTKANIGLSAGCVIGVAYISAGISTRRYAPFLAYLVGGMLSFSGLLFSLQSPTEFLYQAFFGYNIGSRLTNIGHLYFILSNRLLLLLGIPCVVLLLLGNVRLFRQDSETGLLVHGLLAVAIFATWTGALVVNLTLHGFVLIYLFSALKVLGTDVQLTPAVAAWLGRTYFLLVFITIILTVFWYRAQLAVWNWRPSNAVADYELTTPGLYGWRCNSKNGIGFDHAIAAIEREVPPEDSLLILPDATIIYGLTGRESFRKASFIFHVRHVPPPGPYEEFRKAFFEAPPQWILLHLQQEVDFNSHREILDWLGIEKFISESYSEHWRWSDDYVLLRWKGPGETPSKGQGSNVP